MLLVFFFINLNSGVNILHSFDGRNVPSSKAKKTLLVSKFCLGSKVLQWRKIKVWVLQDCGLLSFVYLCIKY